MRKSIFALILVLCSVVSFAQQRVATYTINRGARYTLQPSHYDYHINVDTVGGVVDTTKVFLPAIKNIGQEYLITNSTQDTTKPVVIYAAGTDKLETTTSGTASLTFKPAIKATSIMVRWVAGQSGWKILFKY